MAAADLNGDGRSDVVLAHGQANAVSVLLAGPNGLQPAGTFAAGQSPSTVATADFNGDGHVDLAVVNVESSDVSILLGLGNGTFHSAVNYSTANPPPPFVSRAASLAVADFNHDGKPDIAASHVFAGNRTVTLMIGRGEGTFETGLPAVSDIGGRVMIAADVTNDGHTDLVLDGREGIVVVYAGNGDLTFQRKAEYPGPRFVSAMVAADFNQDGLMDLALTDSGGFSVFVLMGETGGGFSAGGFSAPVRVPAGNYPTSLATDDFNHDGNPDLVTANSNSGDISVLLGDGRGGFEREKSFSAFRSFLLALGDANADGETDVFVANHFDTPLVSVLAGDGTGEFASARTFRAGSFVDAVPFDLDHDGFPDLAVPNGSSATLSVLRNLRDGRFSDPASYVVDGGPYAVAAADLNGDTRDDLVVTVASNSTTGHLAVLINRGDGSFKPAAIRPLAGRPFALSVTDVNLDGKQDVIVTFLVGSNVAVLKGQGDGTLGDPTYHPVGFTAPLLAHGDLDGDAYPDLVLRGSEGSVAILMNSEGAFIRSVTMSPGGLGDLALIDVDADNRVDLVTANLDAGTITVFRGSGDGSFGSGATFAAGHRPRGIRSGDFTGDGVRDLVVANINRGFSLLRGSGHGTFGPPESYLVGPAGVAAAADFDQNGRLDLAVTMIHRVAIVLNHCDPSPTIRDIRPPYGIISGGETVEIRGMNLADVTSVLFGGSEAVVTFRSNDRITVLTPTHSAGSVTVSVSSSGGISTGTFLYLAAIQDVPAMSGPLLLTFIAAITAITLWRLRQF
ncbi:MAG TPA: FG-GAP-like repeat-containing protein [Rhodothermales bacterium]|nr:FG-GAP-like repeat-containing protein [Rhodothermales bacterium]